MCSQSNLILLISTCFTDSNALSLYLLIWRVSNSEWLSSTKFSRFFYLFLLTCVVWQEMAVIIYGCLIECKKLIIGIKITHYGTRITGRNLFLFQPDMFRYNYIHTITTALTKVQRKQL